MTAMSHPTWVRGLKLNVRPLFGCVIGSHPTWVRGLKHKDNNLFVKLFGSHPTWVRGLKQVLGYLIGDGPSVASYVGAWIETNRGSTLGTPLFVASYVGAWIETFIKSYILRFGNGSHPTWVRGLKLDRRLPEGWEELVASYVGAWIETSTAVEEYIVLSVASYVGAWIETSIRLHSVKKL